jgi:DNA-binding transcriptional ArsR family regulator
VQILDCDRKLPDAWWAAVARRLLHRIQVEVIEEMGRTDEPMSARDLAKVIGGVEPSALTHHHLRRLRALGVVEYAGGQAPRNSTDVPYRLIRKLSDDGR